jgi:hypothetical protein
VNATRHYSQSGVTGAKKKGYSHLHSRHPRFVRASSASLQTFRLVCSQNVNGLLKLRASSRAGWRLSPAGAYYGGLIRFFIVLFTIKFRCCGSDANYAAASHRTWMPVSGFCPGRAVGFTRQILGNPVSICSCKYLRGPLAHAHRVRRHGSMFRMYCCTCTRTHTFSKNLLFPCLFVHEPLMRPTGPTCH